MAAAYRETPSYLNNEFNIFCMVYSRVDIPQLLADECFLN